MYNHINIYRDLEGSAPSLSTLEPTKEPRSAGDGTTRKSEGTGGLSPTKYTS